MFRFRVRVAGDEAPAPRSAGGIGDTRLEPLVLPDAERRTLQGWAGLSCAPFGRQNGLICAPSVTDIKGVPGAPIGYVGASTTGGSHTRQSRWPPPGTSAWLAHIPPAQRLRYRRPKNRDRQNSGDRVRPSHSRSESRRTGLWMHSPSSPGSRQSPGQSPRQCLQWRTSGMLTPGVDVARGWWRRPRWWYLMMHAALPRGCPRAGIIVVDRQPDRSLEADPEFAGRGYRAGGHDSARNSASCAVQRGRSPGSR